MTKYDTVSRCLAGIGIDKNYTPARWSHLLAVIGYDDNCIQLAYFDSGTKKLSERLASRVLPRDKMTILGVIVGKPGMHLDRTFENISNTLHEAMKTPGIRNARTYDIGCRKGLVLINNALRLLDAKQQSRTRFDWLAGVYGFKKLTGYQRLPERAAEDLLPDSDSEPEDDNPNDRDYVPSEETESESEDDEELLPDSVSEDDNPNDMDYVPGEETESKDDVIFVREITNTNRKRKNQTTERANKRHKRH